jgi:hypothetical protein
MNKFIPIDLPVRRDVEIVTYHRPPTKGEIRFGHGATHYKDFPIEECCHKGTRFLKKWFVAKDDGLRYYR